MNGQGEVSADSRRRARAAYRRASDVSSRALVFVLAVLIAFLAADAAQAMSVSPTEIEMSTVGGKSRAQIGVTNDGDLPLPVELVLNKLTLDEASGRTLSAAGDEFLVFPPQAMIAPGETQVFRLQWVGEPDIAASKSYLMSVSQVPVKFKGARSQVQVVVGLGVVVNVAPPSGTPNLRVVAAGISNDRGGHRHPTITVENTGNVHALLSRATIDVSGHGWSTQVPAAIIRERLGMGLVQPGKRRSFVLPVAVPDNVAAVGAALTYKLK
ncbi:molecular chaperone [Hyphomicrobium methylovorum]|uniref:fimbria/pilus periplasmic chaperone n=1 Tax=Hyphomicrobium methylovorum TaxID=84 RepID=UPI0015E6E98C|nr:fimbria/pilus periplasmic chaperone [Hyphomicrobium methylovorum]MBA2127419.1 molecular chaperone [Hyphomicrobium methylovorum]